MNQLDATMIYIDL